MLAGNARPGAAPGAAFHARHPGRNWRFQRDAADDRLLQCYPDPAATALRAALSERLRVREESIVVGEGAEALIAAALRSFGTRRCLMPVPAFSEYARACAACNAVLHTFPLSPASDFRLNVEGFCELLSSGEWDTAIINNPHNPSGALLDLSQLRAILAACPRCGARLLLDEAFIDYSEHASVVRDVATRPGAIVVRSLTKFYGCPALRVGYAVGTPEAVGRIAEALPAWPITLLAMNALREAVLDGAYTRMTLEENAVQRCRMNAAIANLGVQVFPSAANYLLVRLPEDAAPASRIRDRLIREHSILVRNCDSYEGLETGRYIRIAVRSASENDRLLGALNNVLKG